MWIKFKAKFHPLPYSPYFMDHALSLSLSFTIIQDESFLLPLLNDASILRLLNIVKESFMFYKL